MVPKIAVMGRSFKGIGQYMLHDKGSKTTSERVMFTHTVNLPTHNPSRAMGWMAYTAMHQKEIKRASGGSSRGRPLQKSVYSYSLAWHPSENPSDEHMIQMALDSLKHLDLSGHEAVIVGHDREEEETIEKNGKERVHKHDHKHIHVIVNRVHPETGLAAQHSHDRLALGEWALDYERERGQNFCPKREENRLARQRSAIERKQWREQVAELYQRCDNGAAFKAALDDQSMGLVTRKQGFSVIDPGGKVHSLTTLLKPEKHSAKMIRERLADLDQSALQTKETHLVENFPAFKQKHDWKTQVTDLFKSSDSGRAFKAALNEQGIELALGDRGFCLIDEAGKTHNLNRRIEGYKSKDIRAHLSDIDQTTLPSVEQCLEQRAASQINPIDKAFNEASHTMSRKNPYPELTPPGMPAAEDSKWARAEVNRQSAETSKDRAARLQKDQENKKKSLRQHQEKAVKPGPRQKIETPQTDQGHDRIKGEPSRQRAPQAHNIKVLSEADKRKAPPSDARRKQELSAELEEKQRDKIHQWEHDMRDHLRFRQSDEAQSLHASLAGRTAKRIQEIKDYYQLTEKQDELKKLQVLNADNQREEGQGAFKRFMQRKVIEGQRQREFEEKMLEKSIAEVQAKQEQALMNLDRHNGASDRQALQEKQEQERLALEKQILQAHESGVIPNKEQYDQYKASQQLHETTHEFNAQVQSSNQAEQVANDNTPPPAWENFHRALGSQPAGKDQGRGDLSRKFDNDLNSPGQGAPAFDFDQELSTLGQSEPERDDLSGEFSIDKELDTLGREEPDLDDLSISDHGDQDHEL